MRIKDKGTNVIKLRMKGNRIGAIRGIRHLLIIKTRDDFMISSNQYSQPAKNRM